MLRIITKSTYIRGAYLGGIIGIVSLAVIGLVLFRLGVPLSNILLATPSVMIGFITLWYYFLSNPDPTLLMPNIVPLNQSSHIACQAHQTPLQNEDATIVEPVEKGAPNGPISSYLAPWQIKFETRPTDLYLVFDVGNRGNKAVMLYEYRLHPDDDTRESRVVSLSPETQAINPDSEMNPVLLRSESVGTEDRAFVQPKERITEGLRIPLDIASVDNRVVTGFTLELYATSNHPVDSLYLEVMVNMEQNVVEWQANRSKLQQTVRSALQSQ